VIFVGIAYILAFRELYPRWKFSRHENTGVLAIFKDGQGNLRMSTDPRFIIELAEKNPSLFSSLIDSRKIILPGKASYPFGSSPPPPPTPSEVIAVAKMAINNAAAECILYGVGSFLLILGLYRFVKKEYLKLWKR